MSGHPRPRSGWAIAWRIALAFAVMACAALLFLGGRHVVRTWNPPKPVLIAFSHSLSGPLAMVGKEALVATQMYIDDVNAGGGIDGHPLELRIFDDQSQASVARDNVRAILESPALAVLGHSAGDTSFAAGPAYQAGHIPVVTGVASNDEVTETNPYYFRTLTANSAQAKFLAQYIHIAILRPGGAFAQTPDIHLITSDDRFGRDFRAGFEAGNAGPAGLSLAVETGAGLDASASAVADELAQQTQTRIIVLGLAAETMPAVLKAIRRRGIQSMIILASAGASDAFAMQFQNEAEEKDSPGFFTANSFAIAPMIMDNIGLFGQGLAARYHDKTGLRASWFAGSAQNAVRMLVISMRDAQISNSTDTKALQREKIRAALADIDRPGNAVTGVDGKMWFDNRHDMPRPLRYGYFREGRFLSAPLQLIELRNKELVNIRREMEAGHLVQVDDRFFWLQRLVATGIDLTHVSSIDIKTGTFNAEFYFWLRYDAGDDLPSEVEFSDFSGNFDPARPLQSVTENGIAYRLWRLRGDFKADYNLHDYPFDTQALVIRLRNRGQPRELISYAIDTFGLKLDTAGKSATSNEAFRDLQLWKVIAVRPFAEGFTIPSTLGNPTLFATANRTEYGGFTLAIVVERKAVAFMGKGLLPLFLLTLVVAATLYFPASLAKERATIPVTGILTSAVLLISATNQLPPLGYTVALEYIFYAYFLLCLAAMITGLAAETARNRGHGHLVKRIDLSGRAAYILVIASTVCAFYWQYGQSGG